MPREIQIGETQVLLTDIRMDGVNFSAGSLRPPFSVSGLTGPLSLCYFVRKGTVWLEVEAPHHQVVRLKPGTFVGLSGVVPHWLKSSPQMSLLDADLLAVRPVDALTHFSGPVDLLVGHVPLETLAFANTLSGAVIVPPDGSRIARRMKAAIEVIEDELRDPDPAGGTAAVVRRLSETLLMNYARWTALNEDSLTPALGALVDSRIMRAIAAAARAPLEPWTVARMAAVAGMSRTAFAHRFSLLTGNTPLNMLAQFRVRLAADALRTTDQNVDQVAELAGYGSAAALSRAFRRYYRTTPAEWRAAGGRPHA